LLQKSRDWFIPPFVTSYAETEILDGLHGDAWATPVSMKQSEVVVLCFAWRLGDAALQLTGSGPAAIREKVQKRSGELIVDILIDLSARANLPLLHAAAELRERNC